MTYRIEEARNKFKFGLDNFFYPLIHNKDKIISGLEILSEGVSGDKNLLKYSLIQFYEFVEDNFLPTIKLIERQIEEGKLSKRKYNNLFKDVFIESNKDIFEKHIGYIKKYLKNYDAKVYFYLIYNNDINVSFAYKSIFENLLFFKSSILEIKNIVKYGVDKEDENYYYFEWFNEKKINKLEVNNIDEVIIECDILGKKCVLYRNLAFVIGDYKGDTKDLKSNDKNGVIFFFTVLRNGANKTLLDYKGKLDEIKRNTFNNKKTENTETYRKNYPNRFNRFSEKNNIGIKISNDNECGICFHNS